MLGHGKIRQITPISVAKSGINLGSWKSANLIIDLPGGWLYAWRTSPAWGAQTIDSSAWLLPLVDVEQLSSASRPVSALQSGHTIRCLSFEPWFPRHDKSLSGTFACLSTYQVDKNARLWRMKVCCTNAFGRLAWFVILQSHALGDEQTRITTELNALVMDRSPALSIVCQSRTAPGMSINQSIEFRTRCTRENEETLVRTPRLSTLYSVSTYPKVNTYR
jgi:hypothetical protein